jgi:hypothetical protein
MEVAHCIYCPALADSLEHPLPAAFGEFTAAPLLKDRICTKCNNTLGLLDQQFSRCGPEALLRRFYGVEGRSTHDKVNVFERGSAGGHRLDLRAKDDALGIEVALEVENGTPRQMRHIAFVEESGKTHHLPIREGSSPKQLRAAFDQLDVVRPCKEVRIFYGPDEKEWVERLIQEAWPSVTLGEGNLGSTTYKGAVGTLTLTDRYFRAVAKIGFHYFLTQFPQYNGRESMFSEIRRFILEGGGGVDHANELVGERHHPLLGEMLGGALPDGWRAHVLCAEIKPRECLAHVQMFVTDDYRAPAYTIRLACDASISDINAAGHAYMYYGDGTKGRFAGDAMSLTVTRAVFPAPQPKPVIRPQP